MSKANRKGFQTPGIYVNETPPFSLTVSQAAGTIPVFVGYTKKANDESGNSLKLVPTKIFSLMEYERFFGMAEKETGISVQINRMTNPETGAILTLKGEAQITNPSIHNMYYCLCLYFDNGGGPCYIVSIGDTTGLSNPDEFVIGIDALDTTDEAMILLFPEGQSLGEQNYYGTVIHHSIEKSARFKNRFVLVDVHHSLNYPISNTLPIDYDNPDTVTTISNFRIAFGRTSDLKYAAAYYPNLKTTFGFSYADADVTVVITTNGITAAGIGLNTLEFTQPEMYNLSRGQIRNQLNPILPPSPALAGIYVKVDQTEGVWKSPANISINSVSGLTDTITDIEQHNMNIDQVSGKSVNAIRSFSGKGILVWGARTLDGNSFEWKYISVRRFFMMVEESVKKATYPFVFESNDANTWMRVRIMLENFLILLWRQGALSGEKPEQAFYVRCGLGNSMTAQDIVDGKLIVEIGLAAVRPAEFILLRFEHKMPA